MIFPHTVTVYPSVGRTDTDGNSIRWASPDGTPVPAYVQLRTSTETATGPGQRASTAGVAYLSHFAPVLDAWAVIEWQGQRYELAGDAIDHRGPDGAVKYWKTEIRKTTR